MKLSLPDLVFAGLALTMVGAYPIQEACPRSYRQLDELEGFNHHVRGLQTTAIVNNGVIQLGIHDEGHLNVPGPTSANRVAFVGLQFKRDGGWYEATAPGCLCEGFGVSARRISETTSFSGWANEATLSGNLMPLPIVVEGTSATAVATTGSGSLKVTHKYEPSPDTAYLYQATVTLENLLPMESLTDLRYRRAMDWDIPPQEFYECVSIDTGTSEDLEYASDNGFLSSDPLSGVSGMNFACPDGAGCQFLDNGPMDHGAIFQFLFRGPDSEPLVLAPSKTLSFKIFYGGAPNKMVAADALSKVGAEIYSFGYPPGTKGCSIENDGSPNVFIFGFAGVGGSVIFNNPPAAVCKDIAISATEGCQASITPEMIDGGSTDLEDDAEGLALTRAIAPTGPFPAGTNMVTLTVTDSHGATDTCEASVTVIDDEVPQVNCGTVGVIAPCQEPVTISFGADTKRNGCPVTVTAQHQKCSFCNGAGKETNRGCVVSVDGDVAVITQTGGVQSHIKFNVTAANDNGSLSAAKTCTICTQNPSVDFEPGCSATTGTNGSGGFKCSAGFPDATLQCPRRRLGQVD